MSFHYLIVIWVISLPDDRNEGPLVKWLRQLNITYFLVNSFLNDFPSKAI